MMQQKGAGLSRRLAITFRRDHYLYGQIYFQRPNMPCFQKQEGRAGGAHVTA